MKSLRVWRCVTQSLVAGGLLLAQPAALLWADIVNTASATYSDASGTSFSTLSNSVTTLSPNGSPSTGITTPGDLSMVRIYPNPWRAGKDASPVVKIDRLPKGSTVKIFTVSGRLMRELRGDETISWDLKTSDGTSASSGIYVYFITDNHGNHLRGKLAIIR